MRLGLDYSAAVHARTLVEACKDGVVTTTAEALARTLPKRVWQAITWREGVAQPLRPRFARIRVHGRGEGCTPDEPEE